MTGLKNSQGHMNSERSARLARLPVRGPLGDAVINTDLDGRVLFLNASAEHLTGWEEERAINRPLTQVVSLLDPRTKTVIRCWGLQAIANSRSLRSQSRVVLVRTLDGVEKAVDLLCTAIYDALAQVIGVTILIRTIS